MLTVQNMKPQTSVAAKTKINDVPLRHNLTIDWEGIDADNLQKLAQRTIVHMFHTRMRANGAIPEGNVSLLATDFKLGVRAPKVQMTPEQLLAQLSPEQLTALLKAKGINVE